MTEPTTGELMVHIQYIRQRVDETHADMKSVRALTAQNTQGIEDLEARVLKTEDSVPSTVSRWSTTIGGLVGGALAGFFGGKAGG